MKSKKCNSSSCATKGEMKYLNVPGSYREACGQSERHFYCVSMFGAIRSDGYSFIDSCDRHNTLQL